MFTKKWVIAYDDLNFVWFNSFHTFRWVAKIVIYFVRRQHAATMLASNFYIGTVSKNAAGGTVVRVQVNKNREN